MPQISKQIIKDVIQTLDSYGCGAHHPDLLPLLDQLEGEPVAYMNPDDLCADTAFRWVKLDEFTEPVFTHPAPFTPITADDVSGGVVIALWRIGVLTSTGTQGKEIVAKVVNAYMGAKK